ncbi:MAG TPA: ATP-binding protein, partial [bacterium]|nr:ATP-binding protein [bacterium]
QEVASSIMNNVNYLLDEQLRSLESVASRALLRENLNNSISASENQSLRQSLAINLAVYKNWNNLVLLDAVGNPQLTVSANGETDVKMSPEREKIFVKALGGSTVYSDVYFQDGGSQPIITLMTPVYSSDQVIGVVSVDLDWGKVVTELNNLADGNKVYLFNQQGLKLAETQRSDFNYILREKYLDQQIFQEAVSQSSGYRIYNNQDQGNKKYLIAVVHQQDNDKYEGYNWVLFVEESQSSVFAPAQRIIIIFILVLFLSLILSGLIIYFFFSSLIIRPIKEINSVVSKIAQGDLNSHIEHQSSDEIGKLAKGVNFMSQSLRTLNNDLAGQVEEKTKSLEQQVGEVEKQKKSLSDTQKAIFNILEDVNLEKENSEKLAADLEKFKLAVDNASDHIVITDAEGLIIYANTAMAKITGFAIADVLGKKAGNSDLWGGKMGKAFYTKMWKIIKTNKQIFVGELNNQRKNGEKYVAAVSISPVLNDQNEVIFFVGIERDITREKEIDKAKTEFVSLASHQLRTPLSAINWYVEMLLDGDAGKINAEQKKYLEEVYQGNQRMVELINALLNVSRIDLGTFAINSELIDINSLAKSVIKDLTPKIKEKKQVLIEKYDAKLPLVKVDPKLVRIIFDNLLSNAVKYSPEKATITLTISKDAKDILIAVADTGYGIPESEQGKIFSKLFRASNIRDKETDGTGLGLYIVKSIVESSGGTITLSSQENKGTTFNVKLPLSGMKSKAGSRELT